MENFYESIQESVSNLHQGLGNKIDAHILADLKRMGENGTLTIHTTQPNFTPVNMNDVLGKRTISVSQSTRLYFSGEERIEDLTKENEELKDLLFSMFNQHCQEFEKFSTYKYNHGALSSNENTQRKLIKLGMIKEEECSYKV